MCAAHAKREITMSPPHPHLEKEAKKKPKPHLLPSRIDKTTTAPLNSHLVDLWFPAKVKKVKVGDNVCVKH